MLIYKAHPNQWINKKPQSQHSTKSIYFRANTGAAALTHSSMICALLQPNIYDEVCTHFKLCTIKVAK